MIYYFAFGSNLSPRQTPRRCPGARVLGDARLEDWRFWITTRGGASIVRFGWTLPSCWWTIR